MQVKNRDPRYSTPESLATADEYNAARIAMEELSERIRKHGIASVKGEELTAATERYDTAVENLTIPAKLIRFDPADWPGREETNFTANGLHKHAQWNEARQNWCIAHGIWSAFFEDLTAGKKGLTGHARTRRTNN